MTPDDPASTNTPPAVPAEVTQLLRRWSDGDDAAMHKLLPLVYQDLRMLARHHLRGEREGHTLQGTGLVHEAYLRMERFGAVQWQSRAHFFGWASAVMRHILVDHARARQSSKRGGDAQAVSLDALPDGGASAAVHVDDAFDLVALDTALQRLERLDEQQARVVELRFFGGLSVVETAESLGISAATVKREWATARAWLLRELDRRAGAG